jgi:hypothetical protein
VDDFIPPYRDVSKRTCNIIPRTEYFYMNQ